MNEQDLAATEGAQGNDAFAVDGGQDDLWMGFYWGRDDHTLYFCPFPMLVFGVQLLPTQRGYLPDLNELSDDPFELGRCAFNGCTLEFGHSPSTHSYERET